MTNNYFSFKANDNVIHGTTMQNRQNWFLLLPEKKVISLISIHLAANASCNITYCPCSSFRLMVTFRAFSIAKSGIYEKSTTLQKYCLQWIYISLHFAKISIYSELINMLPVVSKLVFLVTKINFGSFEHLHILGEMVIDMYHNFFEGSNLIKRKDQVQGLPIILFLPSNPIIS